MAFNPLRSSGLFWAAVKVRLSERTWYPVFRLIKKPEADLAFIRLIGFSHPLSWLWFKPKNLKDVCGTCDCVPSVILSNGLTVVNQTYSKFLFQKVISLILPLIYMYDHCCYAEQLHLFSSLSSVLTPLLSWIDLSSACEAFLKEAVHSSLLPCLLNTVALSGEEGAALLEGEPDGNIHNCWYPELATFTAWGIYK